MVNAPSGAADLEVFAPDLPRRHLYLGAIHHRLPRAVARQERTIGDQVGDAGDAPALPVQLTKGRRAEGLGQGACHGKAMAEHGLQYLGPQRLKVVASGDALGQLAQLGLC